MSINKLCLIGKKRQSGAVLIVALVLLALLTLMGVTSISVTTSELKVASNQQAYNSAFDAATSTIEAVRHSPDIIWDSYPPPPPALPVAPQKAGVSGVDFNGTAEITYDHCKGAVSGSSLTHEAQDGDSSSAFGRVVQEIVATGNSLNSSSAVIATNVQVNGVSIGVAFCP